MRKGSNLKVEFIKPNQVGRARLKWAKKAAKCGEVSFLKSNGRLEGDIVTAFKMVVDCSEKTNSEIEMIFETGSYGLREVLLLIVDTESTRRRWG